VRKPTAAAGAAVFFAAAPGVVAGLAPWLLAGWELREPLPHWTPFRVVGALLVAAAAPVLVSAFVRFVVEGVGTPAPVAPTERLVVGGPYRYVRNPMYVSVVAAIVGQALLLGQPWLLAYAALVAAAVAAFARWYEEPALAARFGAEYAAYRRSVPAWRPRLRRWEP
jgi:protein-S-isoprenylcysteine O-methyltransferase Ste14